MYPASWNMGLTACTRRLHVSGPPNIFQEPPEWFKRGLQCWPEGLLYQVKDLLYRPGGVALLSARGLTSRKRPADRPGGILQRREGLVHRLEDLLFNQRSLVTERASYVGRRASSVGQRGSCAGQRAFSVGRVASYGVHGPPVSARGPPVSVMGPPRRREGLAYRP